MRNLIVYNSSAGKGKGEQRAREIANEFCKIGEKCVIFSNDLLPSFSRRINETEIDENTRVIVVGGDGTLSVTIDAILRCGKSPFAVAVFPAGTANDFSSYSNIPKNIVKFVDFILQTNPQPIDLMKVNDRFAIHAVGSGSFTNASTNYNQKIKKHFGKLGYYFKCVASFFKAKNCKVMIDADGQKQTEQFLFFYVVNSKVAGGFKHFSPNTKLTDGKLDMIGIKPCGFFAFSWLFLKMILGRHLSSKYVVSLSAKNFYISALEEQDGFFELDIDGNREGLLPANITTVEKQIKFYRNTKDEGEN